jgi:DNA-directed RNA polymerase I subunit RPA1
MYGEDSLDVTKQTHLQHFDFTARNIDSLVAKYRPEEVSEKVVVDEAVEHTKKALKRPGKYPPALSVFSPSRYLGAMSERYAKELNEYVDDNKLGYIANKNGKTSAFVSEKDQVGKRKFLALSRVKYMRSLVDPGEAVGLLASQG